MGMKTELVLKKAQKEKMIMKKEGFESEIAQESTNTWSKQDGERVSAHGYGDAGVGDDDEKVYMCIFMIYK